MNVKIVGNERNVKLNELFKFCKENYKSDNVSTLSNVDTAYRIYKERGGKRKIELLDMDFERMENFI